MSAQIIPFPARPRIQLEHAADALVSAIPLPTRDEQMAQLLSDIDTLTHGYDHARLGDFLVRLDEWDARTA